jgi:hypothetical protein
VDPNQLVPTLLVGLVIVPHDYPIEILASQTKTDWLMESHKTDEVNNLDELI